MLMNLSRPSYSQSMVGCEKERQTKNKKQGKTEKELKSRGEKEGGKGFCV